MKAKSVRYASLRSILIFAIVGASIASGPKEVLADDRNLAVARNATRCGSLFMILTSLQSKEPAFASAMTELGGLMGTIYAVHVEADSGSIPTNGDYGRARSNDMRHLAGAYERNIQDVVSIYLRCNAWRESIVNYVQGQSKSLQTGSETQAKLVLLGIPIAGGNRDVSVEYREKVRLMVAAGFDAWAELGRLTPDGARDAITRGASVRSLDTRSSNTLPPTRPMSK